MQPVDQRDLAPEPRRLQRRRRAGDPGPDHADVGADLPRGRAVAAHDPGGGLDGAGRAIAQISLVLRIIVACAPEPSSINPRAGAGSRGAPLRGGHGGRERSSASARAAVHARTLPGHHPPRGVEGRRAFLAGRRHRLRGRRRNPRRRAAPGQRSQFGGACAPLPHQPHADARGRGHPREGRPGRDPAAPPPARRRPQHLGNPRDLSGARRDARADRRRGGARSRPTRRSPSCACSCAKWSAPRARAIATAITGATSAFHERFADLARNKTLQRILESLALRSLRLRRLTLSSPGRMQRSLADHARLVGALEDRDGELASALIKANVLGALKLLEQLLADGEKPNHDTQHGALPHHPYRQPAAPGRSHPHDVRQGGGRAGRPAWRSARACARRSPRS